MTSLELSQDCFSYAQWKEFERKRFVRRHPALHQMSDDPSRFGGILAEMWRLDGVSPRGRRVSEGASLEMATCRGLPSLGTFSGMSFGAT
jgi:hypothetical protein